ncbi:primosomal protein DnaI [Pullulanibacillus pueri]|uniref:Primosomal protein DnaI n=1 Tax=Pullulanibacillus pueri TaxID=1437324 RepID=A0A8J2ZYY5_9BACL|nr:primosomal protein DnaI [Pullulanibacillus pueri]MBM7683464.1 primosomal protein DnaI [Pullulanibacillus pueri]GGH86793.1 primosomal protein DnaI [Pullulanibacillus pueri]
MQSIQSTLRRLSGSQSFAERNQKLLEALKKNDRVVDFLEEHPNLSDDILLKNLPKLYEYIEGQKHCDHCPGLAHCQNVLKGHQPNLMVDKGSLGITYEPCHLKIELENTRRQASLIKSMYVPKEVLSVTFKTIDKADVGRFDALEAAGRFVEQYSRDPKATKGLYLHGKFGVGKTYIMGAIMNALAEQKGVSSLMVYTPDFFRELKNSIQDNTLNEKIDYIQRVPVLILDDIGAETLTPWIRDEVLGSLLQYRMMDNLPTLYTSNYDLDELEDHLSYSNKSGIEELKAKRLMERIRHYTTAVAVTGENRRSQH